MQAQNTSALVRFVDVQKSYDGATLVVKNLNLDIDRGEFLTMLGPSGSGKTTCLMMLAGFESTTSGEILLGGESLNHVPAHQRDIGMVFQNYALFPHMSVNQNLAFPLQMRKLAKAEIEQRVIKALRMVALERFGERKPAQLSGGQQQRVAVARALVFEPKLVLMDEPLGALDKQLREQMQYELKRLHEELDITVVYVTHDQSEALTMSNRIAVFNDGVIQQLATPDVLYEQPENAFVASFIGENNTLHGQIKKCDGCTCRVELGAGYQVQALCINVGAQVNVKTTLSLRPERVFLGKNAEHCANQIEGQIAEQIYLGDHIRTRIALCGQDNFIVKSPNSADQHQFKPGNKVAVGWRTEDCRALDCAQ